MKKIFFLGFFVVVQSAFGVVLPATLQKDPPSNDPLLPYQWVFFPRDQVVVFDIDQDHSEHIKINSKSAIRWKNNDELMKRDVVVAVIDTGVIASHPDMKDAVLPGRNFISQREEDLDDTDDAVGHGTFVASVMAANSNNNLGVIGFSNRIKILPLKVIDQNETGEMSYTCLPDKGQIAISRRPVKDRIALAINYAIEKKVDVINLSMGWPRVGNTVEIQDAFKRAVKAGIVLVIGAGNDHHEAQIYPCAYEGVICVGSIDIDGDFSNFSNLGGHVDVVAPGQGILGLWPIGDETLATDFGPPGYEWETGTSQATPFVAATAAVLRGIYPHETAQQIRYRILSASQRRRYEEVNFGLLDVEGSILANVKDFVAPVFKGIEMAVVDPANGNFELPIVIESQNSNLPDFSVELLSSAAQRLKLVEEKSSEVGLFKYKMFGRMKSLEVENKLVYQIKIGENVFRHSVILAIDTQKVSHSVVEAGAERLTFPSNPSLYREKTFWEAKNLEKDKGVELKIWKVQNGKTIERRVVIEDSNRAYLPFGLVASDWKNDGGTGYLFAATRNEYEKDPETGKVNLCSEQAVELNFYWFDDNLNLLAKIPNRFDATVPSYSNPREILIGKVNNPNGGFFKTPVYWDVAKVPKASRNKDRFAFELYNREMRRLYFGALMKDEKGLYFETRTVTSSELEKLFRKKFDLDATIDVSVIGHLTQSEEDLRLGRLKLMIFTGQGVIGKYYELTIDNLSEPLRSENIRQISDARYDLAGGLMEEAWDSTGDGLDRMPELQTLYDWNSGRSLMFGKQRIHLQKIKMKTSDEKIATTIKSFVRGKDRVTLLETSDYVRAVGHWNGRAVNGKTQIYRSSFLPGSMFSQLLVPLEVGAKRAPGLMMDNSSFFSRTVSVYSLHDNGEFFSPIKNSYFVPENCRVGPTPLINRGAASSILLLCKPQNRSNQIYTIDLN